MTTQGKETSLTENAASILRLRYLQEGETPDDMFHRVAKTIAQAESNFGTQEDVILYEEEFFDLMSSLRFLPNSPTLVNAGREARGSLSACFTMSPEDTAESILQIANDACMVEKWGGGIGFGFSKLRPKGDKISTTHGIACGPVAVMKYYSEGGILLTQGSFRSGAHMGQLHISHPDIVDFITSKVGNESLKNFNISVQIPDSFMAQLKTNPDSAFELVNPHNNQVTKSITYQELWNAICESAWATGDPGVVFLDRILETQPNPQLGDIQTSNPCGEEFLEDYGNCCLGSINLAEFVTSDGHDIEWEELEEVVSLSVRFLDNVIEVNTFPMGVPRLRETNLKTRRIGLGVMGWADMLIKRGIPYDSPSALSLAHIVGKFIVDKALFASGELAQERGAFPEYKNSEWNLGLLKNRLIDLEIDTEKGIRHSSVTTIAPTGSISRIAGTSSGIEPHFDIAWKSNILWEGVEKAGLQLYDSPEIIREVVKDGVDDLIKELAETADNGVRFSILRKFGLDPNLFRTAMEIEPEAHVRMQAIWQKSTTNSVSKTINLAEDSTVEDISKAFILAYELGCKAITVYRNNSKAVQVLQSAASSTPQKTDHFGDPEQNRPKKLIGETTKMLTGHGTLYATINSSNSHPTEVFLNLGKSGGCVNTFTEALGRVLSTALSSGIDPYLLAEQLQGITCPHTAFTDGVSVTSVPDALGKILADYEPPIVHTPLEFNGYQAKGLLAGSQNGNLCPRCGDTLLHQEGCAVCRSCAYSECS